MSILRFFGHLAWVGKEGKLVPRLVARRLSAWESSNKVRFEEGSWMELREGWGVVRGVNFRLMGYKLCWILGESEV